MSGAELRRLRLRAGLTQKELAARIGYKRDALLRYEHGRARIPRVVSIALRCVLTHGG